MARPVPALLSLVIAATAAISAPQGALASPHVCGAEEAAGAAEEHDPCCDEPCPAEGEAGECPPRCQECSCCGATVTSPAAASAVPVPGPPALPDRLEPAVDRPGSGLRVRVFRPPKPLA